MEGTENDSERVVIDALVEVIRIFAARGRAIREERARSGQPTGAEGTEARPFEMDAPRLAQTEDEAMKGMDKPGSS
jgi:hypothetical protein